MKTMGEQMPGKELVWRTSEIAPQVKANATKPGLHGTRREPTPTDYPLCTCTVACLHTK